MNTITRTYASGENVLPAIIHRKFGYLVLKRAKISGDKGKGVVAWYGTPKA